MNASTSPSAALPSCQPARRGLGGSRRSLAALAAAATLAGCATAPAPRQAQEVRTQANPADRAQRSVTHFTPALRCMDELMFRVGTRDLTLMMEEMRDSTQKVPVSTRDMMTSAVSDMTRRSRAVRLSAFGSDQGNLMQLLQQAQRNDVFTVLPQYSLRGSVSQIDEDVQRRGGSIGAVAERLGLRLGSETRFSVLGFDAALVDTATFTLVPGVTSKNTTVITRRDATASDGQARLLGAGAVFTFSAARSEGTAQAARNMVELAAVELVGKLGRLPYWQCLGLPDTHPEVQREMEDWFLSMDAAERRRFQQERLRDQRWYDGPVDGVDSPALRAALAAAEAAVRAAEGAAAPAAQADSVAWFRRVVVRALPQGPLGERPHATLSRPGGSRPASDSPAAGAAGAADRNRASAPGGPTADASARTVGADAATPAEPAPLLQVRRIDGSDGTPRLEVRAERAGYVYCYAVEVASGKIQRMFPNRFARDPAIAPGETVHLPGKGAFRLPQGHEFACVHAPREVYAELPAPLRWGDFEVVRLSDLQAVREAFATAAGQPVTLVGAIRGEPAASPPPAAASPSRPPVPPAAPAAARRATAQVTR